MANKAAITGWGSYSPARVLDNSHIAGMVDTTDEWILSRTGIRERRLAGPGETTASMCTIAGQKALERAQLSAKDIDLVICATTTPDFLLPATACLVQQKLGAARAGAFDLNTACSSFLYGLTVGSQFIQAGTYQRVLLVCGETLSRFTDWQDRNTCVLFGDGASAVVLEATTQNVGLVSSVLGSRGDVDHMLVIEGGCGANPASEDTVARKSHYIRMRGNDVFKMAVRSMTQASLEVLEKAGLTLDDVRMVIPHQANRRIITAMQESLGLPSNRLFINVDRYGNTGAASIPLALDEFLAASPVRAGDNLLMVTFGGGLTWAAAVVRWADLPLAASARKAAA